MIDFILKALFLFAFAASACNSKDQERSSVIRPHYTKKDSMPILKPIIDSIVNGHFVESEYVGMGGKSKQYERFEQLTLRATTEELTKLTDHKSSIIRCYAFQALVSRKTDSVFPILLKHLYDTASVETFIGCIMMPQSTGDYFIQLVHDEFLNQKSFRITKKQKKLLDSILFNDKNIRLSARAYLISRKRPTEKNYKRIREIVEEDRDLSALKVLAKYRKQTDKSLIASFFNLEYTQTSALSAVIEFPDPYFYPYVKKVFELDWKVEKHDSNKWEMCYQALARYPRKETLEIFERTTKIKPSISIVGSNIIKANLSWYNALCSKLLIAIKKYPNKLYQPLILKIKLDEPVMNQVKNALERDY